MRNFTISPADSHDLESSQEHRQRELDTEFADLPAFKRVLISDRDRYLAYSLKKAAEPTETGNQDKAKDNIYRYNGREGGLQ